MDTQNGKLEVIEYNYSLVQDFTVKALPEPGSNVIDTTFVDIEFDESVNKPDKEDYLFAVGCGLITTMVDFLFVHRIDLVEAKKKGSEQVEKFVINVANSVAKKNVSDIEAAIRIMEEKFRVPSDSLKDKFGGGYHHHMRDFSHHPSMFGLVFSIITQFTGYAFGTDKEGNFIWCEVSEKSIIGDSVAKKIFNGTVIWAFHLISDMAGSSSNPGKGTGIPGPILSLFKELSVLPFFKDIKIKYKNNEIGLSVLAQKIFNGTFFKTSERVKVDLRAEIGLAEQIKSYSIPVIVNETLIDFICRARSFLDFLKNNDVREEATLMLINPQKLFDYEERRYIRMKTISSGVYISSMTSVIALEGFLKGGKAGAIKNVRLKINYIGVGYFVINVLYDIPYIRSDIEDVKKWFKQRETTVVLEETNSLNLLMNEDQIRILYSLYRDSVRYDIAKTTSEKSREKKEKWLDSWEKRLMLTFDFSTEYFYKRADIYKRINFWKDNAIDYYWAYYLAIKLVLFKPYRKQSKDDKSNYRGVKYSRNYIEDVFCIEQQLVSLKEVTSANKLYKQYEDKLRGKDNKGAKAVAIAAAGALAGGAAMAAAPRLAVALVGSQFAGLSGAALYSASLAFLGGGSLAAGGLGMAGGTIVLTGGSAILGSAITGSIVSVPRVLRASSDDIIDLSAMILTTCKLISDRRDSTISDVSDLIQSLNEFIQITLGELEALENTEEDKAVKKEIKIMKAKLQTINKCYVMAKDEIARKIWK